MKTHFRSPLRLAGAVAMTLLLSLLTPRTLKGQAFLSVGATNYNFTTSVGLVNTRPLWEGDANFNTNGVNVLDFANSTYASFALGTFVNGATTFARNGDNAQTALQITYTLNADTKDAGSIIALFDTSRDGAIGSTDKGFAFNLSFTGGSGNTAPASLNSAFSIVVNSGTTPSNIAFTPTTWSAPTISGQTNSYTYSQTTATVTSTPGNISMSFAVLIADIDSTLVGTNVLYTLLSGPSAGLTSGTQFSAASTALIDYYGSNTGAFSTANANAGTVLIPEPSTWAMSGALFGAGLISFWRRRRAANPAG